MQLHWIWRNTDLCGTCSLVSLTVHLVFLGAHSSTVLLEQLLIVLEHSTLFEEVRVFNQLGTRQPLGRVHAETALQHATKINLSLSIIRSPSSLLSVRAFKTRKYYIGLRSLKQRQRHNADMVVHTYIHTYISKML